MDWLTAAKKQAGRNTKDFLRKNTTKQADVLKTKLASTLKAQNPHRGNAGFVLGALADKDNSRNSSIEPPLTP